jgi:hypothetical protein
MPPVLRPLEQISTQTLLGIRFWDRMIERPVAQGLQVTAQRLDGAVATRRLGKPVRGRITPSGTIAFFGLSAAERPAVGATELLWDNPPADQFAVIDVVDLLGRYLPMAFVVRLPQRGPFLGEEFPVTGAPWLETPLLRPVPTPGEAPGVYLWSAPTRNLPPGATALRAQLVVGDSNDPPPAAYALVEVAQPADEMASEFRYFGLADGRGNLLLPLPYPPIPNPDDLTFPPLAEQTFNLRVTVHYQPSAQEALPGSSVPHLTTLLSQDQAPEPVRIGTHFDAAAPAPGLQSVEQLAVTLPFDQSLVLRTAPGSLEAEERESVLRIVLPPSA